RVVRRRAQRADGGGLDLAVGRHEGHPAAACERDAGLESRADAAVGRVARRAAGEGGERGFGRFERAVARAVVDEDDLGVGLVRAEPADELAEHGRDVLFLVEREDDDRERGGHFRSQSGRSRRMRAGLPTTTAYAGTSRVTTAPAPTCAPLPMVTPGRTIAPTPTSASSSMTTGANASGACRIGTPRPASRCTEVRIFTQGPTPTFLPMRRSPAAWK